MAAPVQARMTDAGLIFAAHDIDDHLRQDLILIPGRASTFRDAPAARCGFWQEWEDAFALWCARDGLRSAIERAIAISAAAPWPDDQTDHVPDQP